jgi:hypothetical protein
MGRDSEGDQKDNGHVAKRLGIRSAFLKCLESFVLVPISQTCHLE